MSEKEFDVTETCPFCESENIFWGWNVEERGYVANCKYCGRPVMLCDECKHADDNLKMRCDWHMEGTKCVCFRGSYEMAMSTKGTAKRIIAGGGHEGATAWYECDRCGTVVDPRDNYCSHCGRELEDAE